MLLAALLDSWRERNIAYPRADASLAYAGDLRDLTDRHSFRTELTRFAAQLRLGAPTAIRLRWAGNASKPCGQDVLPDLADHFSYFVVRLALATE
jgi:hypothetical protein